MKKIKYFIGLVAFFSFLSCSNELDTNPTDKIAGNVLLQTPEGGQTLVNGIYRVMYVSGWGSAWTAENSGIMAYVMAADLMGEDHVMLEQGQGWFFYDYLLDVAGDYTRSYGRSGQSWNFFYTIVNNANIVIGEEDVWEDSPLKQAVVGQAYAMRAFAYYFLAQLFQQAYVEGGDLKGVPLYTEPTNKETEGKPRGKLEDVYGQMNRDIDNAIICLQKAKDAGWVREHTSYVDYYVANGIKARIALAQGVDYQRALDGAEEALKRGGLSVPTVIEFLGWNKKDAANALWALEVISSQSEHFEGFFSHMDADAEGLYASKARRLIASGLYDLIPSTDDRKTFWWRAPMDAEDEENGNSKVSYCQLKFRFASAANRIGDYLIMRAEEMVLIAAEASCRLDKFDDAREYLTKLGGKRDSNYEERLAAFTNENTYSLDTNEEPTTLLGEILLQRRIELWGEFPRVFDLKRLQLGYTRNYSGSNHTSGATATSADKRFVLPIPQVEFNGNNSLDEVLDQNPM